MLSWRLCPIECQAHRCMGRSAGVFTLMLRLAIVLRDRIVKSAPGLSEASRSAD
jgi:hypothetical protein